MKIGVVTHYMPPHIGGIELVADSLYRAYLDAGFEVRWVASREPSDSARREDGRIRVGSWNGLERKLGVPWPVLGPEGIREINRLVQWADVVHLHDSLYEGSFVASLLARRARKPVILSQHIGFVKYRSSALNAAQHFANLTVGRAVMRRATRLVFCTRAAEQFATALLRERLPATSYIANGVDTNRFRPPSNEERRKARLELGLQENARVALFVGRLVEKKGIDVLAGVIKRMPDHLFLIAGDGPLRTIISSVSDNTMWFPSVAPEMMPAMYQAADVLVLPSHGEGLPLSVQEAMATGLPVIVSKDEAFTSTLDSEGACLASERTSEAFCFSMKKLADGADLALNLVARSRELAVREWSLDTMTARYVELIRELDPKRPKSLRDL